MNFSKYLILFVIPLGACAEDVPADSVDAGALPDFDAPAFSWAPGHQYDLDFQALSGTCTAPGAVNSASIGIALDGSIATKPDILQTVSGVGTDKLIFNDAFDFGGDLTLTMRQFTVDSVIDDAQVLHSDGAIETCHEEYAITSMAITVTP